MTIYSFWIYDRHCNCIYSREYTHSQTGSGDPTSGSITGTTIVGVNGNGAGSRRTSIESTTTIGSGTPKGAVTLPSRSELLRGSINCHNNDNTSKLLFGICFSLRKISSYLVEDSKERAIDTFNSNSLNNHNTVRFFTTLNYKCHIFESLAALKFIVVTDMQCRDLGTELDNFFNTVYLKKVVENPLCQVDFKQDECIDNEPFIERTDAYWSKLVEFN